MYIWIHTHMTICVETYIYDYISQPLYLWHSCNQNTWESNFKKENHTLPNNFWEFTVLDSIVSGLILSQSINSYKSVCRLENSVHLMVDRKQKARKALGTRYNLKGMHWMIFLFQVNPTTSLGFNNFQHSTAALA